MKHADVVFENFTPGVMDRLGAGYAQAREANPRIVYCSLTGYGTQGDSDSGKALDAMIQALSGVMMTSGVDGDPPVRVGVPFADLCTPLFGVIGVLSALHQARRTGLGQHVDVSMLGVMSMMVAGEPFDIMERCGVPQRTGLTVPRLSPFGIYRTSDGYISICAYTERFAQALFQAIGRPDLCSDPKFATRDQRVVHVRELDRIIEDYTSGMTSDEAVAVVEAAGVPAARVRTPAEAVRDPRTIARADTVKLTHPEHGDVEDVYGMGMPIKFSQSTAGFHRPAPGMGEHNDVIYGGLLGYSEERIQDLRRRGVI